MKKSLNFSFNLPEYEDAIDIEKLTDNFSSIDTALMATRVKKTKKANSIEVSAVQPYAVIKNNNEVTITYTDIFDKEWTLEAGKSRKFAIESNSLNNFKVQVKDGLEADFEWFIDVDTAIKEGGGGGTGGTKDYDELNNRPKINGVTLTGNVALTALGIKAAAGKDVDTTGTAVTSESTNVPTSAAVVAYVTSKIGELPKPMQIKGTLGTASGATATLPTAAEANTGWLYIVVTDGTYASQAAVIGDMFVSNGSKWLYVPSGNELFDGRNIILTEYAKGSAKPSSIVILATDSVNEALKKIEWALDDKANKTTTINGKPLSSNVTLSGNDEKLNATSYAKDEEAKDITKDSKIDEAVAQLEYRVDNKVNKTSVSYSKEGGETTSVINVTDAKAQMAMVAKISGKTQKMVQMCSTTVAMCSFATVTKSGDENTLSSLNTSADLPRLGFGMTVVNGHKYYICLDAKTTASNITIRRWSGSGWLTTSDKIDASYKRFEWLATSTLNATANDFPFGFTLTSATSSNTITIKNCMVFDLTAMFGSGKEPSTVNAVREIFTNPYYEKTDGMLMNAPVESVVSQGRNIFDKSVMYDAVSSMKTIQIKAKANTTYSVLATCPQASDSSANFFAYNSSGSPTTGTNGVWNGRTRTVTTSADGVIEIAYRLAGFTPATTSYLLSFDYCIVEGSTAVNVPYNKTTVLVPSAVKNLPDYGLGIVKSDGTIVANEVDFENGVYHHRVKAVDLGTLTWSNDDGYGRVYTTVSDIKRSASATATANIISAKYTAASPTVTQTTDKTIGVGSGTSQVLIKDTSITSSSVVGGKISALNGVMLVYELAQEETKPLTDFIRPLPVENGGTLTLVNEHSLDVNSVIKYKKEV